jgi:hypothetical protein
MSRVGGNRPGFFRRCREERPGWCQLDPNGLELRLDELLIMRSMAIEQTISIIERPFSEAACAVRISHESCDRMLPISAKTAVDCYSDRTSLHFRARMPSVATPDPKVEKAVTAPPGKACPKREFPVIVGDGPRAESKALCRSSHVGRKIRSKDIK